MGDYYTGKEILLGLRQELKNLDKEFRELDKMIIYYNDEKHKDSHFVNLVYPKKLSYSLISNFTLGEKIKSLLLYQTNLFDYKGCHLETSVDQSGNHILIDNSKNLVSVDKQKEFNEKVEKILQNKFAQEINSLELFFTHLLTISTGVLGFDCDEKTSKDVLSLRYRVMGEQFDIYATGKNRFRTIDSIVDEALSIRIPKYKLTPFLHQIIEENPETKKEIYVPNERYHKQAEYYLNQDELGYSLVKKR